MIKLVMVDIRCWDKRRAWASGESCACKLIMGLDERSKPKEENTDQNVVWPAKRSPDFRKFERITSKKIRENLRNSQFLKNRRFIEGG